MQPASSDETANTLPARFLFLSPERSLSLSIRPLILSSVASFARRIITPTSDDDDESLLLIPTQLEPISGTSKLSSLLAAS